MIVSQDDDVAKMLVDAELGVSMAHPFVGLLAKDETGIAAAFVFNNFDHINIDLTIVARKPLTIGAIRDIARYVFGRLGCRRVTCLTSVQNHRAINRLGQLKFRLEAVLRERLPSGDAFQFCLLASEQRFVRLEHGQHSQPA